MATLSERLLEVMRANQWEHADLVRVSGESSSVVSQWLGKGSKEIKRLGRVSTACRIAAASGFAAPWIAEGIGPKRKPPEHAGLMAAEPTATYGANSWLAGMERALEQVPAEHREAVAANLSGWARDGGATHWRIAIEALLATGPAPGKRANAR